MECLLLTQVTSLSLTFVLSFLIYAPIAQCFRDFEGHCILFSSGSWAYNNDTEYSGNLTVEWGDGGSCAWLIFLGILMMFISLYYVIKLSLHLHKGTEQSWLSVFCMLLVSSALTTLLLSSGILINVGYDKWCELLSPEASCELAGYNHFTINEDPNIRKESFYVQIGVAKFGVWIAFCLWLLIATLNVYKLYIFHKNEDIFVSMSRERQRLLQRGEPIL